jgi:hypothetical protein
MSKSKATGSRRFITRIELTKPTQTALRDVTELAGMTQVQVLSRLVSWFAQQDEIMRGIILGQVPAAMQSSAAEMFMRRLTEHVSCATATKNQRPAT